MGSKELVFGILLVVVSSVAALAAADVTCS